MIRQESTLIVEGPDLQEGAHLEALFVLGRCDAAAVRSSGVQCPDFDREVKTPAEAVFGAMAAIETAVLGARRVRLEPDDLVTLEEIAIRTGRTRESSRLLVAGERGPGTFPTPAAHFRSRHRVWRRPAVAR